MSRVEEEEKFLKGLFSTEEVIQGEGKMQGKEGLREEEKKF